jgi:hypothetical protein
MGKLNNQQFLRYCWHVLLTTNKHLSVFDFVQHPPKNFLKVRGHIISKVRDIWPIDSFEQNMYLKILAYPGLFGQTHDPIFTSCPFINLICRHWANHIIKITYSVYDHCQFRNFLHWHWSYQKILQWVWYRVLWGHTH